MYKDTKLSGTGFNPVAGFSRTNEVSYEPNRTSAVNPYPAWQPLTYPIQNSTQEKQ